MISIKQGDALHYMRYVKAGSVDLVIADPPYQSEAGPCNRVTLTSKLRPRTLN